MTCLAHNQQNVSKVEKWIITFAGETGKCLKLLDFSC